MRGRPVGSRGRFAEGSYPLGMVLDACLPISSITPRSGFSRDRRGRSIDARDQPQCLGSGANRHGRGARRRRCVQPNSDGLFEELLEKGRLKEIPLDELVAEAIEQGKNEPNDDILDMFETLHERLVRAQGIVADEIARRRR